MFAARARAAQLTNKRALCTLAPEIVNEQAGSLQQRRSKRWETSSLDASVRPTSRPRVRAKKGKLQKASMDATLPGRVV
eukprot:CAMPEP_0206489732 /NCGR_PEP_ID=MMETSP0324_2-20121206/43496_1 /ASSEMBLY_ACC=CAM_ASM_000836 /TAXON_ID=2866 /ORGANISM="Crypthecodinium cohnii, Strain Seligo" /LENGTH=78 /DNA_ID=CAMNT_0053969629 /DNA_START=206 /DNA_END=439 /DNA_ORIENTATION=+